MKISRFINNPGKPFHSSAYAQVANGGAMGSTSGQTFGQRSRVERSRQTVNRYRDSHVARGYKRSPERTDAPQARPFRPDTTSSAPRNATPGVTPPPARTFVEPPTRPYNPYK